MGINRKKVKDEIRDFVKNSKSYEDLIHQVSIYIFDNYIRRSKPIDSQKILKLRKGKNKNVSKKKKT